MNTEDFVTYEQAVKLKELGFNWECKEYYTNDYVNDDPEDLSKEVKFNYGYLYNQNIIVGHYSAPTLSQAAKWLREVHNLHIEIYIDCDDCGNTWDYEIRRIHENKYEAGSYSFTTYEEALSSGIDKALKIIMC